MKELTESELWNRATAYCSIAEHCRSEVTDKLRQWGAQEDILSCIIVRLIEEKYIDEERYCRAFVKDKYRFSKWGKVKVAQALRQKQIPESIYRPPLEDIDEDEYHGILRDLLDAKRRTIHAKNDYEQNVKLMRFALGRGFEMKDIRLCIRFFDDNDSNY